MTIESWLKAAIADAETRGLPDLKPILEALSRSTQSLRAADFNDDASGSRQSAVDSHQSTGAQPR
jgi:hypothetical protein